MQVAKDYLEAPATLLAADWGVVLGMYALLTCWVLVVLQEGVVVRVTDICLLQEQHGMHSEEALTGDVTSA